MLQKLKVDAEARKISLSLKHLHADPWAKVGETYSIGQTRSCRVTRIADFGAFVELEPGVEALAHMSTFPPVKGGWKTQVQVGGTSRFRIVSVEPERRRIGVALVDASVEEESPSGAAEPGAAGKPAGDEPAQQVEGFGSLADKLRAAMKRSEDAG